MDRADTGSEVVLIMIRHMCLVPGGYLVPGTWYQYLVQGAWYMVPGTWYRALGFKYLVPGTRYTIF